MKNATRRHRGFFPTRPIGRGSTSSFLFAGLLVVLCLHGLVPEAPAAVQEAPFADRLEAFVKTVWELQRVQIPGELDPNVPSRAIHLLEEVKHGLRDLIIFWINSPQALHKSPRTLETTLKAELAKKGLVEKAAERLLYGRKVDLKIAHPEDRPDLLVATSTIDIQCGSDTSFYLFERREKRWELVLALEANGYKEISGAQGLFGYAVSPKDRDGAYFVATAHVTPWCTSNWQGLKFRILRPASDPYKPRVVLEREESVYLGCETPFSLHVEADSCTLLYAAAQHLDLGILIRPYIRGYKVTKDRAERILPLASRPEDFLDEWIDLPWSEAARWSEPGRQDKLKRWHGELKAFLENQSSEITFVQPCNDGPSKWVVGLKMEADSGKSGPEKPPAEIFTSIASGKDDAFIIQDIDPVRPAGCPGEAPPLGADPCETIR